MTERVKKRVSASTAEGRSLPWSDTYLSYIPVVRSSVTFQGLCYHTDRG